METMVIIGGFLALMLWSLFVALYLLKGRYLRLSNVTDIVNHFGGSIDANRRVSIRTKSMGRGSSLIIIERNGFKVDEKRCDITTAKEYIQLDKEYKSDVEYALKKHFEKIKEEKLKSKESAKIS